MNMKRALSSALVGTGLLVVTSMSASAAIVCSGSVCWHTHERYEYPPDSKVVIHEDNWRAGPEEKYTFREHEGRGYWHGDKWTEW